MRKTNEINLSQDSIDAIASTVAIAVTKAMAEMLVAKQPQTPSKKSVSNGNSKKTSNKKTDDDFDRKEYEKIAKTAGCLGKHGCWKDCRPWVKAVMAGEMTQSACNKKVAAFAKKQGWELNK